MTVSTRWLAGISLIVCAIGGGAWLRHAGSRPSSSTPRIETAPHRVDTAEGQPRSPMHTGERTRAATGYTEGSKALMRLPEDDRAWVLERTDAAISVGYLDPAKKEQYIEELASVREFAVLERQETYLDEDAYELEIAR